MPEKKNHGALEKSSWQITNYAANNRLNRTLRVGAFFKIVQATNFCGFGDACCKAQRRLAGALESSSNDMAKHLWHGTIIESIILALSILIVITTGGHSGMYIAMILHFPSSLVGILLGEALSSILGDTGATLSFLIVILFQVFVFAIVIKAISKMRKSTGA